jgi:hypothetical protein
MKCQSCQELVSPKFKAALARNQCPFCDAEIVSPALQTIFTKLQVIMKEAEEFPDLIADWLFANYQLKKAGYKSPHDEEDGEENDGLTAFAKRAGIKTKPIKGAGKFKEVLDQIQAGDGEIESIEQREEVPQDYDDVQEERGERQMIMVDDHGVKAPLSGNEQAAMFDVFESSGVSPVLEAEKLKRMQRAFQGGGKISRNED